MPAFKRLQRSDLDALTRAELQDRIEVESAYWDRKCRRGLSGADAAAHQEFSVIIHAAIDPGASLAHAQHYLETGIDNGYWDEKPGASSIRTAATVAAALDEDGKWPRARAQR